MDDFIDPLNELLKYRLVRPDIHPEEIDIGDPPKSVECDVYDKMITLTKDGPGYDYSGKLPVGCGNLLIYVKYDDEGNACPPKTDISFEKQW